MTQYSDGWTYQENLLAKYHKLAGNEVTVITSKYHFKEGQLVEDNRSEFVDINGVKVIRIEKTTDGLMKKFPVYKGFYETLCNEAPDIIFSHGCQYKDTTLVKKYVKKHPDVKLFVDNHADFTNSATNFLSKTILHKTIWKHYAHQLFPYTEKFWGVLPARVDFLIDVYKLPREKCDLLVMGADDELVEKSNAQKEEKNLRGMYGIKESDFLIVTGGKIDKAKIQTELLITAVKKLERQEVKLLFFGSIEEEIKERILSLVDGKQVIYAGWVSPEESYDYFTVADLVVFPGRHSVFWEQVAGQGKPMVCRSWPGTHHIDVGGNVAYLNYDSEELIRKTIEEMYLDKGKYETMKRSAAENGLKTFLYSEIAKKSIGFICKRG